MDKPFASLSSGLLARKGQARPAMRPQGFSYGNIGSTLDDLGWNDMGQDVPPAPAEPAVVVPVMPAVTPPVSPTVPPVLRERAALREEVEAPAPTVLIEVPAPPAPTPEPAKPASSKAKAKAAFTLRLDPDRHLRLRLAAAVAGRSAQLLVTEALDAFFRAKPELDELARQLPDASTGLDTSKKDVIR